MDQTHRKLFLSLFLAGLMLLGTLFGPIMAQPKKNLEPVVKGFAPYAAQPAYAQTITATKRDETPTGGSADPGDTITYTIRITNTGSLDALDLIFSDTIDANTNLSGTIQVSPLAFDDVYTTVGNTLLEVGVPPFPSSAPKVTDTTAITANDYGFDGANALLLDTNFGLQSIPTSSDQGGTITNTGSGSFQYTPPPGFSGDDHFTYIIADNNSGLTTTGEVTITVGSVVWYVDNTASAGGNGTSDQPFEALIDLTGAVSETGDIIYVHEGTGTDTNLDTGITLLNNQQLLGEGVALTVDGFNLAAAGNRPTIGNGGGNGITLGSGNTVRGLNVGASSAFGMSDGGSSVGTLTIAEVTINNTSGGGMQVANGGTLDVDLTGLSSSGGTNGLSLVNVSGVFTAPSGAIAGSSGVAVNLNGGTAAVNYGGAINNSANDSVAIQNRTGGAVTLSGNINDTGTGVTVANNSGGAATFSGGAKTINTGADIAVNLTGNSGHTINFTGGGLNIDTTTAAGFNATGGGTVNVTGAGNSIDAGTATALNVANTTIGASDLTFQRISAPNSSSNIGIVLNNTGSSGGLTITGNGAAGSGGTIANKTGANGSTTSGIGIYLNETQDVSLSWLQLNDFANFAIRGATVTNFTLANSVVDGSNGNSTSDDEGSISFDNLLGTVAFNNSNISGGFEDNIFITNNTGTLNMTVSGGVIGLNDASAGNDGILVESQASSTLNLTVDGASFLGARGDLVQCNAIGNSTMDCTLTDNTFNNTHSNTVSGGGGVTISGGSATSNITLTYDVSGSSQGAQTFRGADGNAITVNIVNGNGTAFGFIRNNDIGVSGVAGSGSASGAGISVGANVDVEHRVLIDNNNIFSISGFAGIDLISNVDAAAPDGLYATVTNNNIGQFGGFALAGIYTLVGGNGSSDTSHLCADIQSNTIDASGSSGLDIFADQINFPSTAASTYNFPGYGGPSSPSGSPDQLATFWNGQNTLAQGAAGSSGLVNNVSGAGTACLQP